MGLQKLQLRVKGDTEWTNYSSMHGPLAEGFDGGDKLPTELDRCFADLPFKDILTAIAGQNEAIYTYPDEGLRYEFRLVTDSSSDSSTSDTETSESENNRRRLASVL